jgi:hypothetical protein
MLKANVGLSRKITRDFNSTGYTVNLEGEIAARPDDAEGVLEKVSELFHLAEEALAQELDRDRGEQAIGRRDEERPEPKAGTNGSGHSDRSDRGTPQPSQPANGNGPRNGQDEAATNKQVQFLLSMGKRLKLSTPQLENRIAEITCRRCGAYDLTKKEAGLILDHFTKDAGGTSNGRRRS